MMRRRIGVERSLYERARQCAERAGYSSVEELVQHALEKEVSRLEQQEDDHLVRERLRGLGYLA